jgi:hypothetical protein
VEGSSPSAQALYGKESPAREPEPTATHRLGVDVGKLVEKYQEGHWMGRCSLGH